MEYTKGKVEWSHRRIPNDEDEMTATQVYTAEDGQTIATLSWYPMPKEKGIYEGRNVLITRTYRDGNAELIAESFNVANESGFTPRQLLEQRNELLDALKKITEMNYQQAFDQYGNRNKAKTWSCVLVAEQAVNKATTTEETK